MNKTSRLHCTERWIRVIINAPSAHLGIPLLIGFGLFAINFKASSFHLKIAEAFGLLITLAVLIDLYFALRGKHPQAFGNVTQARVTPYISFFSALWAGGVIAACLLDIALFKPALLDRNSYYQFTPLHAYIRFFSNWCWTLVPIGLLSPWSRKARWPLLAVAFAFPLLVIDRNRLLHSAFALILVWLLFAPSYLNAKLLVKILLTALLTLYVFGEVGNWRNGDVLSTMALPYKKTFKETPQAAQWTTLYGSAGLYNLSDLMEKNYRDKSKLVEMLGPTSLRPVEPSANPLPLDVAVINVGTEFLPFYLAYGIPGILVSGLIMVLCVRLVLVLFSRTPTVFSLIMIGQVSYVTLLAEFNPQFFKLSTLSVVLAALAAGWLSQLAERRRFILPFYAAKDGV